MTQQRARRSGPALLLGLFVLGAVASMAASLFVTGVLLGVLGTSNPIVGTLATSAMLGLTLMVLSRFVLHAEGATLAELGLVPDRSRLRQFGFGAAVSAILFVLVAVLQSAMVKARWEFLGIAGLRSALIGLGVTAVLVFVEELLFRGVALRQLRAMYGDRGAIVLSALLFGGYHLVQSDAWAMGAVFTFLMPTLGGLVFGWAAVRSNGLALPLGLHLGGNWVQASVAGFSTAVPDSGGAVQALWHIPVTAADVRFLVAPDLLPRLPYLVALALAAGSMVWAFRRGNRLLTPE